MVDEVESRVKNSSTTLQKNELLTLLDSVPPLSGVSAAELRSYLSQLDATQVEVGWPTARSLLDVWRYRSEIPAVRESFEGWPIFLDALESAEGVVGLVGLRNGGPVAFVLILSEQGDRILAVLSKK
ncbi:hypothetical protein [Micromonospora echinofusca]|uniref:hypothetical protein n=1 Tax=Micromonospora echinofusca TaxID=47858 RepID=UPI001AD792D1|nr:hypothetical protein [Micromonospora echinofusca]